MCVCVAFFSSLVVKIDVVQREESRSIKEWNDLLEIFDNFLVDFNLRQQGKKKRQRQQSLSQAVILAGAIITVASHRVERFGELFHQLRSKGGGERDTFLNDTD